MREELIKLILERLEKDADEIKADFHAEKGIKTHYAAIDNLFPEDIARKIYGSFPPPEEMRLLDSFREKKYTSKSFEKFNPLIEDATFAFQDERVIEKVAELTGIKDPKGDPHLYAGVKEERDDGIVISGAQMLGTGLALADYVHLNAPISASRVLRPIQLLHRHLVNVQRDFSLFALQQFPQSPPDFRPLFREPGRLPRLLPNHHTHHHAVELLL
ncbi:MAG: hypothetical protein ABJA66_16720, partial [Actinomycetota bacterium]